ncbi:MAG: hypothetical protein IKY22_06870 [Bacteroidales bacterium]|nr:hypothetical protein [Bacteroidales bacterium]
MKNERYDFYKRNHPEWSDEQIWTAISLDMQAENVVEKGGEDIDLEQPDVVEKILVGARNWLSTALPQIFQKVKDLFNNLINTIASWVQKGLSYVVDLIGTILGR